MLSISLIDLLPEAAEEIGFIPANLCFYAGVLFFAAIVALIPEPDAGVAANTSSTQQLLLAGSNKPQHNKSRTQTSYTPPAPTTAAPAAPSQPVQDNPPPNSAQPAGWAAADEHAAVLRRRSNTAAARAPAAAALDRSCPGYMPADSMPAQQQQLDPSSPGASSCGASTDLQVLLSEEGAAGSSSKEEDLKHRRQLLMSALVTAVGIGMCFPVVGLSCSGAALGALAADTATAVDRRGVFATSIPTACYPSAQCLREVQVCVGSCWCCAAAAAQLACCATSRGAVVADSCFLCCAFPSLACLQPCTTSQVSLTLYWWHVGEKHELAAVLRL